MPSHLPKGHRCDWSKYPPSGGDGKGTNSCDDWPPVKGAEPDCACEPNRGKYNARKAMLFLNIIPMVGQAINAGAGMPGDCTDAFQDASEKYADANVRFTAVCQKSKHDFEVVVNALTDVYQPDPLTHTAQGILPTTVALALQPGMSTTLYLNIICAGIFLVLLGVLFTI